ncbi:hypothetical protein BDW74DRAFT_141426 [Aspergillus multicolor]|uniref:uncharacterized protein n=1 Tax=Aspergillus multicolor TaxID=41759 RepID=UPI003CCD2D34
MAARRTSLGPSALPEGHGSPASQDEAARLSRSDTLKSSTGEQHDWAYNRSPLQKLEVAIGGISKEEKRARALEAERRLRERMATATAKPAATPEPEPSRIATKSAVQQLAKENEAPVRRPSRKEPRQQENRGYERQENITLQQEPDVTRPQTSRARAPAIHGSGERLLSQNQDASNRPPSIRAVRGGSTARRPVSITHQLEKPRMSPHEPNQAQPRNNYVIPHPEMTLQSPRANTAQPRSPTAGKPLTDAPSRAPQSSSSPEQGRQDGRPFPAPAATVPSDKIPPPHEVRDSAESIIPESNENIQRPQTKSKRHTVSFDVPPPTPPPLSEWKTARTVRLGASDFDLQALDVDRNKAWWESGTRDRRQSRALPKNYQQPSAQKPTSLNRFQPLIFLKCGPLLRYTGIKRVTINGPNGPIDKETWRGTIMIVTKDSISSYEPVPTLRVFSQPMDLLPPPPVQVNSENVQLPPEYIDPTAGLMKLGRDGRPLYVKPVDHTEEQLDLSSVENDDGIYEMSPSAIDYGLRQPVPANRVHSLDGETVGMYKEISGFRLYADSGRDVTFWRFNLEIELGKKQQRIAYRLNQGPAIGFWVPAKGQAMNVMYHSGNGFTPGVDSNKFCGPDPLWRDVLNEHQTRPFHVMIGGGDQIFNDRVTAESMYFKEWLKIRDASERYETQLNPEFKNDLENGYLGNYSRWFSQGLFSLANSQIPMVNMWNDHEILEGFGSYPEEFMSSAVISGLGNLAFKYYMLFQHHSVPEETEADEPSWILGAEPGPYINQRSRHLFMSLGNGISFLGLDCRTERMYDEIISEHSSDLIWDRCHREIVKGETKHLVVLLSIPIAYPRVAMVKNILNSRQSLGKAGLLGGLVNRHGAKVEIFDDHWTAKQLKSERKYLIEDLQDLAAEKSVRVTILSGDVHLAAVGQFYSNPNLNTPKDRDYRYMPNIISSGIVDAPVPEMVSDTLNRRNQVHHMDSNTDEEMIPFFTHDVNNKPRNNKRLLPRRNWCSIRLYEPGATPPETPESEPPVTFDEPRPNKLQRTLSLGRGERPQGLLRRLSSKGRPPTKEFIVGRPAPGRRMSMDGPFPPAGTGDSYFPPPPAEFRPGPFLRRPTNLSQKSSKKAAKRGDDGAGTFVNLEGGLAVTLNLELNPKDPSGITVPYKLLVPALWFEGTEDEPPALPVTKGWRKWLGVRRNASSKPSINDDEAEEEFSDEEDEIQEAHALPAGPPREGHATAHPAAVPVGGRPAPTPAPAPARRHYDEYFDDDDDDEDESELFLSPEPEPRPNVKRSNSIKKWFGRREK